MRSSRATLIGIGVFSLAMASDLWAAVTVTPRHLMILRPGLDAVYGSYIFAVQNDGDKTESFSMVSNLPLETSDFAPQEGLMPEEIKLAEGGGVRVEKAVPKGVHVFGIGFKVDGHFGKAKMTLKPQTEVKSLTVLVPKDHTMTIDSAILTAASGTEMDDPQYKSYISSKPLEIGSETTIMVSGLPEGRGRLWILGGAVSACLLLAAGYFGYRTRPTLTEDKAGGAILVG